MFGLIMKFCKRNSKWWLVSSLGNKILVNKLFQIAIMCAKFMFLSKNHDIWKWIVFLFIIIYQIFKKNKNSKLLSIISGINISQKLVLQRYLLSSGQFIRGQKYRIYHRNTVFECSKTIHIISSQIIPKCITLIQITN